MGVSRPKQPMHTSESAATAVAHSLRVQDVAMLCARRVLEFDMQGKRNAMPCRRGGEGSRWGAKGRKAKMRLRVASHLPPVRRVLYTSLVVPAPIVCFPPEKKIVSTNFRLPTVSFSPRGFRFVGCDRPANGEGESWRKAAIRACAYARASATFRFLPSLLHPVAASC